MLHGPIDCTTLKCSATPLRERRSVTRSFSSGRSRAKISASGRKDTGADRPGVQAGCAVGDSSVTPCRLPADIANSVASG